MSSVITAVDPATGTEGRSFPETTPEELEALLAAATAARDDTGWRSAPARTAALADLCQRLRDRGEEIVEVCRRETGLSEARLRGELERTWRQIMAFVDLIATGEHYEAIIETADPDARPVPRPDLRRMVVPLGPVAVFAASNFPLAFSVAGGDTASALAAGCPVVCKAHPAHPGTSQIVGAEISAALAAHDLPAGMFGLVQTASVQMATALVGDDRIEGVGFTGSLGAGRAIFDAAARRPRPIPVYAEMGSVNPVVVTEAAIVERRDAIAQELGGAVTRDAGQLCTKPGLVFVPAGAAGEALTAAIGEVVSGAETVAMLNRRLRDTAAGAAETLQEAAGVSELGRGGAAPEGAIALPAAVFATTATRLREDPRLTEERFGPVALAVTYDGLDDLLATLDTLGGQLTATLHVASEEHEHREGARAIVDRLLARAGRIIFNGVPTGVSVTAAQFHGGPYPATTASATTSVGTLAIRRFLRPVAWQDAPPWLLPEPLRG